MRRHTDSKTELHTDSNMEATDLHKTDCLVQRKRQLSEGETKLAGNTTAYLKLVGAWERVKVSDEWELQPDSEVLTGDCGQPSELQPTSCGSAADSVTTSAAMTFTLLLGIGHDGTHFVLKLTSA